MIDVGTAFWRGADCTVVRAIYGAPEGQTFEVCIHEAGVYRVQTLSRAQLVHLAEGAQCIITRGQLLRPADALWELSNRRRSNHPRILRKLIRQFRHSLSSALLRALQLFDRSEEERRSGV